MIVRKKPAIQLDKEPTIMVLEPDATVQRAPQDNQLMSKHSVLSLKPQLRLEWQGHDGQNKIQQPDHCASLGDFITASTRIRFSVHTGVSAGQAKRQLARRIIKVDRAIQAVLRHRLDNYGPESAPLRRRDGRPLRSVQRIAKVCHEPRAGPLSL
jgi:hypothetical protein